MRQKRTLEADNRMGSPVPLCAGTGLTPPTSAPGLHHPGHICAGTGAHPSHICTGAALPGQRPLPVQRLRAPRAAQAHRSESNPQGGCATVGKASEFTRATIRRRERPELTNAILWLQGSALLGRYVLRILIGDGAIGGVNGPAAHFCLSSAYSSLSSISLCCARRCAGRTPGFRSARPSRRDRCGRALVYRRSRARAGRRAR